VIPPSPHLAAGIAARTFICWEKTAAVAVKIKLKRLGRTRVPTYRIVVADARTKRDGRAIEEIGKYHPKEEPSFIEVNSERAQHWLSVGAQPTPPVLTILKITGDWQKFKGEPGAEGTLRTRETAPDKKETFATALKDAGKGSEDSGSTTPKGGGRAKKADSKAEAKTDTDTKPESGRAKSKASSEKTAAGSADDSAAAAAVADAPAEADAPATADAPAEADVTATADAPAAADEAVTADADAASEA
jgi:small subunit ribosomal protein S16